MNLDDFEKAIQKKLFLNEKDSIKMARSIKDISSLTGMESSEILEFLEFGAEKELKVLNENYDWNWFQKAVIQRLRPK